MVVGKEPKAARDKAESQSKHNRSDSAHDVVADSDSAALCGTSNAFSFMSMGRKPVLHLGFCTGPTAGARDEPVPVPAKHRTRTGTGTGNPRCGTGLSLATAVAQPRLVCTVLRCIDCHEGILSVLYMHQTEVLEPPGPQMIIDTQYPYPPHTVLENRGCTQTRAEH